MAISYYFDAPVHRAIKIGLQLRGVEVMTAQEDNNSSAIDEIILSRSLQLKRPLVTTDHDFLVLAKNCVAQGEAFTGIFFLSPKVSIGYAIEELEVYAKIGELEDFANQVIFV
ncbi:DUF5615 family PIN-like protein [Laspinema palackyanum]|uniref:DUF5615 family PIN-like protein n=1 Tax=Laspinema palackyanum TaxID=3231601 RepID=UPI00345CFE79|nr:DUF5615 family PIN-like protein [Laspinema sp. D2c]